MISHDHIEWSWWVKGPMAYSCSYFLCFYFVGYDDGYGDGDGYGTSKGYGDSYGDDHKHGYGDGKISTHFSDLSRQLCNQQPCTTSN
ncbi:keratin-associated protein 6-2-like isoform X2 [Leucoraja erinacea]|uniref:keratin-associated protein 6-2-like isoform X2 n=1 Tax=Leucoraja erinaceus TaxID=7782 RepID=UPI002458320B|nr:keratin-associated protein 6-2-like isoform X2 [Leucoraja erinacea]